jgi:hypothetical protein
MKYRDMKLDPYVAAWVLPHLAEMVTRYPYSDEYSRLLDAYVAAADKAQEVKEN